MMMTVVTKCPMCGKVTLVDVRSADYDAWQHGKHVQDAFPYLPADEREMLITGICSECWDKMFGVVEEDDEA